jgi:Icc-related predicted phosphoesterase
MRLHVVSDVHGSVADLRRAGEGADALVVLGDLLLFIDYADHTRGIMGDLFGAEAVGRFIQLRTDGRFADASAYTRTLWSSLGTDPRAVITEAARRQYADLFAALPTPTYLTYGNVDLPPLWAEFLRAGLHVLDGQTVEIGGWTFGFVGGGIVSPMRTPYELTEDEHAARIDALGPVDVLCCHVPPAVPELRYDTVARRFEVGSAAMLTAIRHTQPRYALFGHVHQPLQRRIRIGRTECVNVGHFRGSGEPFVLRW